MKNQLRSIHLGFASRCSS